MNIDPEDLEKIRDWAKRHSEISEIWIYGSRAREDNHPDSDIDLAIVMKPSTGDENTLATWMSWFKRFKESPDLNLKHNVHLEWYEPNAGLERVGPGVQRDGVRIYSAGVKSM